jgi:hypothetical protein
MVVLPEAERPELIKVPFFKEPSLTHIFYPPINNLIRDRLRFRIYYFDVQFTQVTKNLEFIIESVPFNKADSYVSFYVMHIYLWSYAILWSSYFRTCLYCKRYF